MKIKKAKDGDIVWIHKRDYRPTKYGPALAIINCDNEFFMGIWGDDADDMEVFSDDRWILIEV